MDGDLVDLVKRFKLSASSLESSKEIEARIRREDKDADHERKKDLMILWSVVVVVGLASFVCVIVLFLPHTSAETIKWATTLLTTVVAGVLAI